MGTTSEKLTYLNVTKQKLKQAINNIGGEVTDETTFRNYVAELENAYDRLPKTEFEEGESVTLENTLKGKLDFQDGKVGFGQASQESTNGYNLAENNLTSKTVSGLTITVNEDKSITINGTATALVQLNLLNNTTDGTGADDRTLPAGSYYLSGCPQGSSGGTKFKLDVIRSGTALLVDTGEGSNPTLSTNQIYTAIRIVIYNGTQCNNLVFKPMLNTGNTAKPYEPYTGGYSSPSPNWEQPIEYVRGWNLFNKDKTPENYYIDGSGGKVYVSNNDFINQEYSLRGTVTISFTNKSSNSAYVRVCEYNGSTFIRRTLVSASGTYPLSTNCDRVIFSVDNSESVYFTNLQIEEGSTPHPYLPYNTIEEVVSGKNKLNWTMPISVSASGNISIQDIPQLEVGKKYYFYGKCSDGTRLGASNCACVWATSNTQLLNVNPNNTFTGIDLSEATQFYVYLTNAIVGKTISEFMLIKGEYDSSNLPTYEPYITPTSYQLSLGEIELNAIGNYKDELIYDVDEDKAYKNEVIGTYTFDGDDNWVKNPSYSNVFYVDGLIDRKFDVKNLISEHFVYGAQITSSGLVQLNKIYTWDTENLSQRVVIGIDKETANDVNTFFYNNHSLLLYVKNAPTLTELTDTTLKAQVKAWYNAQSNNGTTIITSNGNLPMIIKVRGLKGE
mgnify:CR=1 FL=1